MREYIKVIVLTGLVLSLTVLIGYKRCSHRPLINPEAPARVAKVEPNAMPPNLGGPAPASSSPAGPGSSSAISEDRTASLSPYSAYPSPGSANAKPRPLPINPKNPAPRRLERTYDRAQLEAAKKEYEDILAQNPNDAGALEDLSQTLYKLAELKDQQGDTVGSRADAQQAERYAMQSIKMENIARKKTTNKMDAASTDGTFKAKPQNESTKAKARSSVRRH